MRRVDWLGQSSASDGETQHLCIRAETTPTVYAYYAAVDEKIDVNIIALASARAK
jgi:hypothetical protein